MQHKPTTLKVRKYTFEILNGEINIYCNEQPYVKNFTCAGENAVLALFYEAIDLKNTIRNLEAKIENLNHNGQPYRGKPYYRKVEKMAFAGSDNWFWDIGQLYDRLGKGLNLISGLQQPIPCTQETTEEIHREFADGWEEVEAIAADLVCGLLGPNYKIVKVD